MTKLPTFHCQLLVVRLCVRLSGKPRNCRHIGPRNYLRPGPKATPKSEIIRLPFSDSGSKLKIHSDFAVGVSE